MSFYKKKPKTIQSFLVLLKITSQPQNSHYTTTPLSELS